jgi:PAS domain S-box-containing protein
MIRAARGLPPILGLGNQKSVPADDGGTGMAVDEPSTVARTMTGDAVPTPPQPGTVRPQLTTTTAGVSGFAAIFGASLDGVLVVTLDGRVVSVNRVATQLLCRTQQEVSRAELPLLTDPSDERLEQLAQVRTEHGRASGHARFRRPDGSTFTAEISSSSFVTDEGEGRACIVFKDLTARDRTRFRVNSLNDLTRALLHHEPSAAVMQQVAQRTRQSVGATFAWVVTHGDEVESLVVVAGDGLEVARIVGLELPTERTFAGRAIAAGRPLIVTDLAATPDAPALAGPLQLGPALAFPMVMDGRPMGAVVVANQRGGSLFTEEDRADVGVFAQFGAEAIAIEEERIALSSQRQRSVDAEQAANDRLAEQLGRLRELDTMRTEFITNVSHELRTPLTSIVSFTELLLDPPANQNLPVHEFLQIIHRNAQRLERMVSRPLLLTQLEHGQLELEKTEVFPAELLEDAASAAWASANAGEITVQMTAEAGPAIWGDREWLLQLFDNLITNAIKFTEPGGRIDLRATLSDGVWRIEVQDTGAGVPADEVARIFDRFYRASNAREGAVAGTGLGLGIVRAIAELHDGTVEVRSVFGEGTTVSVLLPAFR